MTRSSRCKAKLNPYSFLTPYFAQKGNARMNIYSRPIAALLMLGIAGCSFLGDIPDQFRIDQGVAPEYQDEDVRFRTTYYFRVFDICEEDPIKSALSQTSERIFTDKPFGPYKLRNDSLYRFRMTGKSNAYFSKVHFESGTLRAEQIDVFGASVQLDKDSGNFKVISARQSRDEAQLDAKLTEINKLLEIRSGNLSQVSGGQAGLDNVILDKIQELNDSSEIGPYSLQLAALNYMNIAQKAKEDSDKAAKEVDPDHRAKSLSSVPSSETREAKLLSSTLAKDEMAKRLELSLEVSKEAADKISETVKELAVKMEEFEKSTVQNKEALSRVQARLALARTYHERAKSMVKRIEELEKTIATKDFEQGKAIRAELQDRCPNGRRARRGFQILGPEGVRTFDQDERLLMALSYDAKPLISLLQELSSRKLSVRQDIGPLRELAKERISLRDARYELNKAKVELEQGDPEGTELSVSGVVSRIRDRFKNAQESKMPELDLATTLRPH